MRWQSKKASRKKIVQLFGSVLLFVSGLAVPCVAQGSPNSPFVNYDPESRTWTVGNESMEAIFQHSPEGFFRYRSLVNKKTGRVWAAPAAEPSSPIRLTVDGITLDENATYQLLRHSSLPIKPEGVRVLILFSTQAAQGQVRFEAEVYAGQPFLRFRTFYTNTKSQRSFVTEADMLSWKFAGANEVFRGFFVGQWKFGGARGNFEPHEVNLTEAEQAAEAFTGAYGDHSAWGALRDGPDHGIVAGWEYDGRARAHAEHRKDTGVVRLDAQVMRLNHPLGPLDEFAVPAAFLGLFQGDWDEAGYRTQRFVEAVLAAPMPDPEIFPYVMFDTWGYGEVIHEDTLRQAAERAAALGAEVFTVDLGWAVRIGDWYPDPEKFPNGLKAFSDYVHSLGMKFGLHFAPLEAMPDSAVLREHPDWEAYNPRRQTNYFGATPLCASHRPVREWIIAETLRIIREYGVDWLLQDGENMVKYCESTEHSHDPNDSVYSNAVDGLHEILHAVQEAEPGVVWENCEDGGGMQTFHMVQHYVTSIINDNADHLVTRQGVWGSTFPFPPRYTDRYMIVTPDNTYVTRSHMFGGPFILMQRITEWSWPMLEFMRREVEIYKSIRQLMRDGKVYHLTPPPDGTFNDAIQSYHESSDQSVIFLYREDLGPSLETVWPRGLRSDGFYRVSFQETGQSYTATGSGLMEQGIPVTFRQKGMAEIISIQPVVQ